jgi:hypothetical protein
VSDIKRNIPTVQVKNKPHTGGSKHAFISWLNGQYGPEQLGNATGGEGML